MEIYIHRVRKRELAGKQSVVIAQGMRLSGAKVAKETRHDIPSYLPPGMPIDLPLYSLKNI